MECTLADYMMKYGSLKEYQAACVFREIVKAVDYCHKEAKLIHYDIKPNNILLSLDPKNKKQIVRVKIADFGLSRGIDEKLVGGANQFGSLLYMAPEMMELN